MTEVLHEFGSPDHELKDTLQISFASHPGPNLTLVHQLCGLVLPRGDGGLIYRRFWYAFVPTLSTFEERAVGRGLYR